MTDLQTEHLVHLVNFDEGTGYNEEMSLEGGNVKQNEYVDDSPDMGSSFTFFKPGKTNLGRAIKPFDVPEKLIWHEDAGKLPDCMRNYGRFWVSDKVKGIIEALEPGIHQFFELEGWALKDGTPAFVRKMHIFNVCNLISAADRELTTVPAEKKGRYYNLARTNGTKLNYVADLSVIGDRHFWIERNTTVVSGTLFMSDKAKSALSDANASGFRPVPFDAVHGG